MRTITTRRGLCGMAMLSLATGWGCSSGVEPDAVDPTLCPQTSEFPNYGCARMVVVVEAPSGVSASQPRWMVQMSPLRSSGSGDARTLTAPGPVHFELTRFLAPPDPATGDTLTVRLAVNFYDAAQPTTIIASDTTRLVVRYAPVGARPPVDTVRLRPAR